jgi:hypothetical protein
MDKDEIQGLKIGLVPCGICALFSIMFFIASGFKSVNSIMMFGVSLLFAIGLFFIYNGNRPIHLFKNKNVEEYKKLLDNLGCDKDISNLKDLF